MASTLSILALAALLVPPLLLNAALRLHWSNLLWAAPLLLLTWTLLLIAAYLFACHLVNRNSTASCHPPHDQLGSLPRLAFLTQAAWSAQLTRLRWARESHAAAATSDLRKAASDRPDLDLALDQVIQLILRDFVGKWHTPLASGSTQPGVHDSAPEFVQAVEHTIRDALHRLATLAARIDHADLVVRRLMPRITAHIHSYRQAELDFRGVSTQAQLASAQSDQTDLFLARKFDNGRLHSAVGDMSSPHTKPSEHAYLRAVAARLIRAVMPYPECESASVHILVRELLSCTVIFAVIESVSDPDFWNNLLEQKAGAVIHEKILVGKLREALDKQDNSPTSQPRRSRTAAFVDLDAKNLLPWSQDAKKPDQKSFDAFLKSIRNATSLLEVRRTKNDIAVQIRKTKTNLERASDDAHDASRAKLQSYLHRLETAHAVAEQKVAQLSSHKGLPNVSTKVSAGANPNASRVKLHHVLLNPSSLSIFMEFMDRRKRSILVQFWMLVESFKNPLEDPDADPHAESEQLTAAARAPPPSPTAVQTLKEDLRMFDSVYYSNPVIRVSKQYVDSARQFLATADDARVTALQVWRARRDVLRAQKQIYEEMEDEDWPSFREGDLFIKAAQDLNPDPHLAAGLASSVGSLAADPQAPLHHHTTAALEPSQRSTPRPSKPTFEHADLFGTEGPIGPDSARSDLFGDSLGGSRSKASAKSDNLDILIGGRTQHAGPDGRTPLFREDPLFDEADEAQDEQPDEDARADSSSDFIHIEKIDELQCVLQSIIDDDLNKAANRPAFASLGPTAGKTVRLASDPDIHHHSNGSDAAGPHRKAVDPGAASAFGAEAKARNEDGVSDAAPVSLGGPTSNLPQEMRRLDEHLEKLEAQAEILDALTRKAELTGARSSELRLLAQSVQAVRREARETRWQRNQLEQQEAATQLVPGQTRIAIQDTMISTDHEGKEYAVYLIEVGITEATHKPRGGGKGSEASATARGWIVGRRYSEFWSLHQALKERLAEVRALESDFPGKRLVGLVHAPFVDARKAALEKYLQALVKLRVACESEELRHFLSQTPSASSTALDARSSEEAGQVTPPRANSTGATPGKKPTSFPSGGLVKTLFKGMTGVAEGLDDLIGIGPSMLDVVVQRLSTQVQGKAGALGMGIADIDMVSQAMDKDATPAELREAAGAGTTYWTEPICDLFSELFELHEKNNWLRRQAIVILLQQLVGSTVERKIRETFSTVLAPPSLTSYLVIFRESVWPKGVLREPTPARSPAEKDALRENANSKLASLIPELAANFVGRENARKGTRRVFSALQNKRLNKHLIYSLFDVVVDELLSAASTATPIAASARSAP